MPDDELYTMLSALPLTVTAADEASGYETGALSAATDNAGLSFGDRSASR